MNMKQDLRFVLTGLFVAALSCLAIARADLIVTPVGLSASKTIFEPGESNDVFFIQNTSTVAVQITAESVACPNTGGDKTDNITCSILTSAKLRNIPGKDPDGTVHGIFASVTSEIRMRRTSAHLRTAKIRSNIASSVAMAVKALGLPT
jgi:hypothetical protein